MKEKMLIATNNPHKQKKLKEIVDGFFKPVFLNLPRIREVGETFQGIAEHKAKKYSAWFGGWAIATDGGARIPAIKNWNALRTSRFSKGDDFKRMDRLLKMMKGKRNKTVYWDEALTVAHNGKLIFSTVVTAMPAKLQESYDLSKYEPGHWLDSLCLFPRFSNKNFFDLTPQQKLKTEDSWIKLQKEFAEYFNVAKSDIEIIRGHKAKEKIIEIKPKKSR